MPLAADKQAKLLAAWTAFLATPQAQALRTANADVAATRTAFRAWVFDPAQNANTAVAPARAVIRPAGAAADDPEALSHFDTALFPQLRPAAAPAAPAPASTMDKITNFLGNVGPLGWIAGGGAAALALTPLGPIALAIAAAVIAIFGFANGGTNAPAGGTGGGTGGPAGAGSTPPGVLAPVPDASRTNIMLAGTSSALPITANHRIVQMDRGVVLLGTQASPTDPFVATHQLVQVTRPGSTTPVIEAIEIPLAARTPIPVTVTGSQTRVNSMTLPMAMIPHLRIGTPGAPGAPGSSPPPPADGLKAGQDSIALTKDAATGNYYGTVEVIKGGITKKYRLTGTIPAAGATRPMTITAIQEVDIATGNLINSAVPPAVPLTLTPTITGAAPAETVAITMRESGVWNANATSIQGTLLALPVRLVAAPVLPPVPPAPPVVHAVRVLGAASEVSGSIPFSVMTVTEVSSRVNAALQGSGGDNQFSPFIKINYRGAEGFVYLSGDKKSDHPDHFNFTHVHVQGRAIAIPSGFQWRFGSPPTAEQLAAVIQRTLNSPAAGTGWNLYQEPRAPAARTAAVSAYGSSPVHITGVGSTRPDGRLPAPRSMVFTPNPAPDTNTSRLSHVRLFETGTYAAQRRYLIRESWDWESTPGGKLVESDWMYAEGGGVQGYFRIKGKIPSTGNRLVINQIELYDPATHTMVTRDLPGGEMHGSIPLTSVGESGFNYYTMDLSIGSRQQMIASALVRGLNTNRSLHLMGFPDTPRFALPLGAPAVGTGGVHPSGLPAGASGPPVPLSPGGP